MNNHELILVLDFGGQYNQLIARRVRESKVYCEVLPHNADLATITAKNPKGIIFTGGPSIAYEENAPSVDPKIFELGIPILGICYGAQLTAHLLGGTLEAAQNREYGKKELEVAGAHPIYKGVHQKTVCWMSHTYHVTKLPSEDYKIIAQTDHCPIAAFANDKDKIYGFQYHPEVVHTTEGRQMLENFLYEICGCQGDWIMSNFVENTIQQLKEEIGDRKVLCALSGGVDSSVAAMLVHKAVGHQLTCIFVDNGLLRKDEGDLVEKVFTEQFDLNLIRVNAQELFLSKLAGITDPETKRKNIGETFIRVFEAEADKLDGVELLVQGTIYPDVIESGSEHAAVIKSHHNVGGLPEDMSFTGVIEPLRDLFKDEVREVGRELGLPGHVVDRQPFPGPGLAIRVIGDITEEKLDILREADWIYREEIRKAGLAKEIWQYFAVLTGIKTVGVMGDERTYNYTIGLRGVTSLDGMTADWARIPYPTLEAISTRIVNEVQHVNRIVYDITSKPPATIEWE
ncbi:glutamine-hydrolyzing GMP synthase [Aureispira sp. CCB-QB1]|uniref:glutamine-hydrolyzing GMP synthase n=1 Tax=Aureispira sp. CCB-QB1 TaxID=1313421 RepID=UPI0006966D6E|nr:glutamine-hydrolyzing GMP synthase [Aureispira sp. CCB-QB1]